jgi:thiol-disulfide isomerase/thioredoxin
MKRLVVVLTLAVGTLFILNHNKPLLYLGAVSGESMRYLTLIDLYEDDTELSELSEPGAYTVVDVYSDSCGPCIVLERSFPAFLEKRNDFVIKRVEGGIGVAIAPEGMSEEVLKKLTHNTLILPSTFDGDTHDFIEDILDKYDINGYPHIEIYDADGRVVAKDNTYSKSGTKFLQGLIAETSGG